MNDYHSSSSSSYSSPSSSPSPMLGTPSPLYDDSSHSEKDFFSNFSCCGLTLADMHQLVEHYEEAHALVFGSDGKPLYPAFQSATSPHPSPLTSLAVGYPQPSSYPYPKNPLAYTHTESSSALGVGFPDLEEPYNPFGFDDYGFISPPHHHAHPYPSSTSTTAYNYDHPPLLRINTSFPRPSISSDTSSTSSSSPPPLTATTTTYSSAPSPLSVSWSASSSVYNSPDLKPSGLVDDHHHHRHHPQAKCLPPALLSLPPQISLRRPQPLPLKSQVSSLRVADSGKTRSMPVQIVEPYGLPPSISRRKSTFGGGLVSQPPQAQTQVQRPQVQRPQQPQPQQPQVQQPQQTQAQRPQQTQAQQQTKTKDQEKDGSGGGVGPHRTVHARDSAHSSPYMHGVGGHGKVQTQTQVQTTQTGRPTQAQTTQAGRPIQVQTTQAGLQMHLTPAGLQMQMTHPGLQKQIQAMQAGRPMQMQTGRQMLVQTGRPASTVGKKKKDGREKAFKCPVSRCFVLFLICFTPRLEVVWSSFSPIHFHLASRKPTTRSHSLNSIAPWLHENLPQPQRPQIPPRKRDVFD
ncbi:hypothetical protein BDY19DRAFT_665348 [Irpex rosettiformis]|uniref:Uncharacterized protein n=1 Tax=Irpex rosettiformis TaxID=378272 RepID=A0ACB8U9D4_9APHY|nr:hypothetical protein BDY19DRAFT_665348 [Irpex rosettiformis]